MTADHSMTADFLEQLRSGDNGAWESFYDQLAPELRAYIARLGARDPDDVLGETMMQIVRDINKFFGAPTEIRAWSFRIAHNRVIDASRRKKTRPAEVSFDETFDPASDQMALTEVPVTAKLSSLLEGLTSEQRSVVWLRYVTELTLDETAEVVGKTPEAVAALTYRALTSLRRSLLRAPADSSSDIWQRPS
jgi:RNA polymerase sigma-70 factor (ECF subfamily)